MFLVYRGVIVAESSRVHVLANHTMNDVGNPALASLSTIGCDLPPDTLQCHRSIFNSHLTLQYARAEGFGSQILLPVPSCRAMPVHTYYDRNA